MPRLSRMCSGRHVLIVEDDDALRDALAEAFANACGSALAARDGAEALALVTAGAAPCAIVTDIEMPRMDGRELIQALVRGGHGHIPVVTMSGMRWPTGECRVHLQKPFEAREVLEAVRRSVGDVCALRVPAREW